jgi:hypothetical protein
MKYKVTVAILVILSVLGGMFLFRPVCVPLSDEDLKNMNVPIEERNDRDFYLKVFQKKDGHWHQCKTWVSRQFFF